ncbi:MAG: beta-N-acetylhexosaminidase [Nitrospinae bacterium]|nr:beta-N-acetylhexosaminidase [Nitrospinota bacterium]
MAQQELSLAEKVGQVFMVGFEGTAVTPELAAWLRRFAWGGVMLFGRNTQSPTQLRALSQALQEMAHAHNHPPLLIAVDQEGGRVTRLKAPFTPFPSAALLGRLGSAQRASEVGRAIARELQAVGITMNMAPVLDVLTNPANAVIGDRAFGSDPGRVGCLGAACIHGMRAAGVLTTGKHFPGHGDTDLDSHVARPVVGRSVAWLEAVSLRPFREAIHAGVDALMTAHVLYTAWDARYPATLSPKILTGVLREQLGFEGVIITDDLGMQAVAEAFPWEEIPLLALRAGADLLLICHDRQRQEQAYTRVLHAVRSGELPASRLEQAVARIRHVKSWSARWAQEHPTHATLDRIGCAEHRALEGAVREPPLPGETEGGPHDARTVVC